MHTFPRAPRDGPRARRPKAHARRGSALTPRPIVIDILTRDLFHGTKALGVFAFFLIALAGVLAAMRERSLFSQMNFVIDFLLRPAP